jgi:hypothetical protein
MKTLLLTTLSLTAVAAGFNGKSAAGTLFSDSFERTGATPCAIGASDNAQGGTTTFFYLPNFPTGGTDGSNPIGAIMSGGVLQNPGLDFGGVQFTLNSDSCVTLARGSDMGQDLTISMRVRVPTDLEHHITYAGPYFRSRLSARGDGIIGGGAFDPSGGYWVQLRSTGEIRVLRLDLNQVVASTGLPLFFDSSIFHELQVAVQGDLLQIALDGGLQTFTQPAGCALLAEVPNTGQGNQGAAGVAFGTDNRGLIGGQQVDNLVVTDYTSLAAFPTSHNPALWIQSSNTVSVQGSNLKGSVNLSACDIFNAGVLQLDAIDSTWSATVTTEGYITNASSGLIEVLRGAGGARAIFADISNSGTIRADMDLLLTKPVGITENLGSFDISTNVTLSFTGGANEIFNQSAGELQLRDGSQISGGGAILNLRGGTVRIGANVALRDLALNYTGGQLTGSVPELFNAKLRISDSAGASTLLIEGQQNQLQGDIPASQTLWVQGSNLAGSAALIATNGFSNHGVLLLESVDSTWTSALNLSAGIFTNDTSGKVEIGTGAFGGRSIIGDILNLGAFQVDQHFDFNKAGGVFENRGTVDVNTNLSFSFQQSQGQTFNQVAGKMALHEGSQFRSGTGGTLNLLGGNLEVGPNVTFRDVTFNYTGGQLTGSVPYLFNTKLLISDSAAPATLQVEGQQNQLQGDIPANQTLWVQGSNLGGSAALVTTNGFSNHGLLLLESVDSTWTSALNLSTGTFTNDTSGKVEIGTGAFGGRSIIGDILNLGAFQVDQHFDFNKAGGVFENRGTVDVNTNLNFSFQQGQGQTFNQVAGKLTLHEGSQFLSGLGGTLNLVGGNLEVGPNVTFRDLLFNYTGGQLTGSMPYLFNTKLLISDSAAAATVQVEGQQNQLQGDIPASQTLWVQGSNLGGSAALVATNGFSNHGVLLLESVDSTWTSALNLSTGTFTNDTSGKVEIGTGAFGGRSIIGDILNLGTIQVDQHFDFNKVGGIFENRGTVDVNTNLNFSFQQSQGQTFNQVAGKLTLHEGSQFLSGQGGTLNLMGGNLDVAPNVTFRDLIFNYTGGQLTGFAPAVFNTSLRFEPGAAPAMLLIEGQQNRIQSDVAPGVTLWIQGSNRGGQGTLNASTGFANRGIIRVESVDSTWGSALNVSGGVFVNDIGGRVEVNGGSGGPRSVSGQLFNRGTFAVNYDLSLDTSAHTNAGSMQIGSGARLDIAGSYAQTLGETVLTDGSIRSSTGLTITGGSLTGNGTVQASVDNAGTVHPVGGSLVINGNLTQKPTATSAFKTKETAQGGVDSLVVNGSVALGGTLQVELNPSYTPSFGDKFTLIAGSAISGTFASLALPTLTNQLAWDVVYRPTTVSIQVVRMPGTVSFSEPKLLSGEMFQFSFSGQLNSAYSIETSKNLVTWIELTNFTQTSASMQFTIHDATNTFQFYRAIAR